MKAQDSKFREIDALSTKEILRPIESIPITKSNLLNCVIIKKPK